MAKTHDGLIGDYGNSATFDVRFKEAYRSDPFGGTTDYSELDNKPTINGVTVEGDKTSEDYNIHCVSIETIQQMIDEAMADAGNLRYQVVESLPAEGVKGILYFLVNPNGDGDLYEEYVWLNNKWEKIPRGATISEVQSLIADAVSGIVGFDYLEVDVLPDEGVKGIVYLVPHEGGEDDSFDEYIWIGDKFEKIPRTVDLSNYVTFSALEEEISTVNANITNSITSAIAGVTEFDYLEVDELPDEGIKGTIYLLPNAQSEIDLYDEYLWINDKWEKVVRNVDLSNYPTRTEVNTLIQNNKLRNIADWGTGIKEGNVSTNVVGGYYSHAEGDHTRADSYQAHAEGTYSKALAPQSHAEGGSTEVRAGANAGHAEGSNTLVTGKYGHAQNYATQATGENSHSEGYKTVASGHSSHSQGSETEAKHQCQFVFGELNELDSSNAAPYERGNYIEIVGNGGRRMEEGQQITYRSNARTLDWDGNETLAGKLTVGTAPTNDMDVATKKYVDDAISGSGGSGATPSTVTPAMDGTASVGTDTGFARGDHVHPTDTSRAPIDSPTFTGTPSAPTAATGTDSTQLATTAFVQQEIGANALEWIKDVSDATPTPLETSVEAIDNDPPETLQSVIENDMTGNSASGVYSHVEGYGNSSTGHLNHVEGVNNVVEASFSHVEGRDNIVTGNKAAVHVEGRGNTVSNDFAHAEGHGTTASGHSSHAEGYGTTASGRRSHAEGQGTQAIGDYSHAEGQSTVAARRCQHVFGYRNIPDSQGETNQFGKYIEIVGNGTETESPLSNARTLTWSGKEWLADTLEVSRNPSTQMEVATKGYVDSNLVSITPSIYHPSIDENGGIEEGADLVYSTFIKTGKVVKMSVKVYLDGAFITPDSNNKITLFNFGSQNDFTPVETQYVNLEYDPDDPGSVGFGIAELDTQGRVRISITTDPSDNDGVYLPVRYIRINGTYIAK